ncbi:DNA replication/repair protein RecF [Rodentibacter caecimuris]|uniref:DNA replication and repair protein RecF n=1 Tax=Rodentibacter caecimuris TaxID=1796644 RepID=A0AAJ3K6A9_9PAST|nr:DNA replication/repair protein RecF [Rodentibacter heylii]AOF52495.1 DNA recombination and repair protein RecF [Pasteurellaceae bacterium NI1060]MCQ9123232.1 DNA replication/repair protein RecF [Rodentibacter heylii]OOF73544.1 DNA replication/repair protein RecF [Rodentibacter heylii]OOF75866.1 DNA replication/repair protein RecF [Rodentibacter heylii]OOF76770.1 DNA replication/repair protein RecF [Rodentibacter heylii]
MAISRLLIEKFRNLNAVDLEFDHGFNFLVGNNGSGKTSLLEAIFYLGHGRSFKSAVTNRIIFYDEPHFTLFGQIKESQHQWSVGLQKFRQGNTLVKINGEDGNKISDLAHLLPMQLITPEGLTLLNGGPSYRRAFLDWGLFHHHLHFHSAWSNLNRLLKQRNAALTQQQSYTAIKAWDIELAKLAHQVSDWRAEYAEALRPEIEQTCQLFLPELDINVSFHQGWDKNTEYSDLLRQNFERDKLLGYTFSGPQKADFRFKANGLPVEDVLSRGQLKLLMCALRLAQGEHLMKEKQRPCIFLIDDFASELDQFKRELLAERLQQSGSQVFVTAITQRQLKEMEAEKGRLFEVENGVISPLEKTNQLMI